MRVLRRQDSQVPEYRWSLVARLHGPTFGDNHDGRTANWISQRFRSSAKANLVAPSSIHKLIVTKESNHRFWRIQSPESNKVTESYCLVCCTFVCASRSFVNLRMVESLHRVRCEGSPKDINPGLLKRPHATA
jgi:hypothetical protein